MTRDLSWTLEDGLAVLRSLEGLLSTVGFHVALAGSVMRCGRSEKDLDVIVYPHRAPCRDFSPVATALEQMGFTRVRTASEMRKYWSEKNLLLTYDHKHVEVWLDNDGRRIDFICLAT